MRKIVVFLLFFLAAFSLFAQTRVTREPKVFVPLIGGSGDQADNDFFYHKLTYELVLQYNELARRKSVSDYTLTGVIVAIDEFTFEEEFVNVPVNTNAVPDFPVPPIRNTKGNREYFSWEVDGGIYFYDTTSEENYTPRTAPAAEKPRQTLNSGQYPYGSKVFVLELTDSISGEKLARQYVVYLDTDASTGELLAFAVNSMLSSLPDVVEYEDWRDQWLFVGANILGGVYSEDNLTYLVNAGFRASAEYQAFKYMSVELGLQLLYDIDYEDYIFGIPFALKLVFRPQNNLMLEPYAGVLFSHSVTGNTEPPQFSWFIGSQIGFKLGIGMITFDPRLLSGFDKSYMTVQIGVGYKIGFFQKTAVRPGR
jgi:hypothetical protein